MFTRSFRELGKRDAGIAGGKGASLGEMTQAGIPVPPGFVVLADAFEQFLTETDLNAEIDAILHTVNHEEMHTVEHASEKIQALILEAQMPQDIASEIRKEFKKLGAQFVAVRSSATAEDSASAAWAGQLDTFLNTTEKNLLQNVQRCWASLFTPRAIFYRFEKELHKSKISVAVVVQKMVQSEVSGIAFSVHPVTEDRNQLIIEAGFGLGEAIVSGQITPDSYVVEKTPRRIIDKNMSVQERALVRKEENHLLIRANKQIRRGKTRRKVIEGGRKLDDRNETGNEWVEVPREQGEKQALSDDQILKLSEIVIGIEKHYGFPCDIEWAFARGEFYITQSRPITTLSRNFTDGKTPVLPNPRDYDFLWTFGVPYIFSDAHYYSGYSGKDFLLFLNGNSNTLFVSKIERKRLGLETLPIYENFEVFEGEVRKHMHRFRRVIDELLAVNIASISLEDLAEYLEKSAMLAIEMWRQYFPMEYHSLDVVAQRAEKDEVLKEAVRQSATLKFEYRKLLNFTIYEPNILNLFLHEVGKRKKLEFPAKHYRYGELVEILRGHAVSIPDRTGPIVRGLFSKGDDLSGERALALYREFVEVDEHCRHFRGVSAFKGTYRGTVKKIMFSVETDFKKEVRDMEEGDVLVTGSTGPEMVVACKRAGAIITDEGGIISHAAIVARELKKPCIIGTKIATRVLNDGDLVEVDAERGVVTVIERAKGEQKRGLTETRSTK